jgi:hypothetical protein
MRRALVVLAAFAAFAAPASAAPVVGTITAVGGAKDVQTAKKPGAKLRDVRQGESLTLGERIVVGRRTTLTLRLRRPPGVGKNADLVSIASPPGVPIVSTVDTKGDVIIVKVAPAPKS